MFTPEKVVSVPQEMLLDVPESVKQYPPMWLNPGRVTVNEVDSDVAVVPVATVKLRRRSKQFVPVVSPYVTKNT